MPSFDLSSDEIVIIFIMLALVVIPSRISFLGNLLGRLVKGPPKAP